MKNRHTSYFKYRYPIIAITLVLTWVITATYIVQSNTPPETQGEYRTPASVDSEKQEMLAKDHPLLQETYTLAVNAYIWGAALVRLEQVARLYTDTSGPKKDTSYRARLNEFGHSRRLPGPSDTDMPTANQDTLYSSAILDVGQSPMVLSVPKVSDRYYVINMFDMWHNLFKYVGVRETGREAQKFLIVPPNWQAPSDVPKELQVVRASTSKVWLWGRTQVLNSSDYTKAHKIQDQYTLTPYEVYTGKKEFMAFRPLSQRPGRSADPLRFYEELAQYVKDNPLDQEVLGLYKQFKKIGLTEDGFQRERLTQQFKDELEKALVDGEQIVLSQASNPYVMKNVNGWGYCFVLDNFKDDFALRAMVAGPYLGGQGAKEALYPLAIKDVDANELNGSKSYKIHFEKEPPVGAFWSITVYDDKTKLLVENSLKRYSLGSNTKLVKDKNGSFDIFLSQDMPLEEARQSNWLALPPGKFYVITRLYIPSKEILNLKWKIPPLERVKDRRGARVPMEILSTYIQ